MRTLRDFIFENAGDKKSFTFDFTDIENAEETVKSIDELNCSCASVDGNKVTVNAVEGDPESVATVQDILQQFTDIARKSSRNASSEAYAQKTKAFAKKLEEMVDFVNAVDEEDDKKEEE